MLEKVQIILSSFNLSNILSVLHSFPFDKNERRKIDGNPSVEEIFMIITLNCTISNQHIVYVLGSGLNSLKMLEAIDEFNDETRVSQLGLFNELLQNALGNKNPTSLGLEIEIKIDWPNDIQQTVENLREIFEVTFRFLSKYIHLKKIQQGCLLVHCCSHECLAGALERIASERRGILKENHIIYLKIGNSTILSEESLKVDTISNVYYKALHFLYLLKDELDHEEVADKEELTMSREMIRKMAMELNEFQHPTSK